MFLLDATIISELRRPSAHGAVVAWYRSYPIRFHHVPSVAFYEMQVGAERTRVHDPAKAIEVGAWIDGLELAYPMVPFDHRSARTAARFMHGKSLDLVNDAMIAATAATHGLTVATRNVDDFAQFPVPFINPFLFQRP